MKNNFQNIKYIFLIVLINVSVIAQAQEVVIDIKPSESKAINGHGELVREKYFNISNGGKNFESTVNNKQRSDRYFEELQMSFGRDLGMVNPAVRWGGGIVREDANRPGYVDLTNLKNRASPSNGEVSDLFQSRFPKNLGVANHDNHNAYPDFMEQRTTSQAGEKGKLPVNSDAAGELAVNLLKYNYTDWTRPITFEPINEPHWAIDKSLLANLHLSIWEKAKEENISTEIGGPCFSVGYFYKKNYQDFSGMAGFIDNTDCKLDFYSFHIYDYLKWDNARNDFTGRVSTGLPIEGVLDVIPNYTLNKYDKKVGLVFSEHGGYIYQNEEGALTNLANKYFPGDDFDFQMKKRSISNFIMVNSAIANTMAFINHPDVVKKAVPFIILESYSWDPKYYSSLLVANNFTNKNDWQESKLIHFFEFFKDVKGRRVQTVCNDLDVQHHSFVDENKLYVVLNNLSVKDEDLKLNLPESGIQSIQLRRYGRNTDFTPYFEENTVSSLEGLQLKGYEKMVITVDYEEVIQEKSYVNEVTYYGNEVTKQFTGSKKFTVEVPDLKNAEYAMLRVGISRPARTNKEVEIGINNNRLTVPMEDCADYLENNDEYATTKILRIDTSMLRNSNSITVKFNDGKIGGVGAVVLRVAYLSSDAVTGVEFLPDSLGLYKGEEKIIKAQVLPLSAANKMLQWESITPDIISVSNDGKVSALDNGTGKLLVKTLDGNFTDTCTIVVTTLSIPTLLDKSNWEAIWADDETSSSRERKENTIDGKTKTIWTTTYRGDSLPALPHEIWIDMKDEVRISKFQYLPRQDSRANGTVGKYELFVSNDTLNWGDPAAKGEFVYDRTQTYWHKEIQTIVLGQVATGRYFKFKALSEAQNDEEIPITAVAEFYAYAPATGISIPSELSMEKGETISLPDVLTVPGDDVVDKELITWTSSKPDVVSIGYGTLYAKSAGSAEITVSTLGGQYSSSAVVEVSVPTSVEGLKKVGDIQIYPNPVSGNSLNLVFPTQVQNLSVKLYSMSGSLLAEDTFSGIRNAILDLGQVQSKGMSIVKIIADGEIYTEKIVIQ